MPDEIRYRSPLSIVGTGVSSRRCIPYNREEAAGRMEDSHERRQASVQRRRVPADGEAGIFSEDDRVELMDGEVVEMAPIGDRHVESVMRLNRLISRWALIESG